ncbi:PD-(D/E)XK motif protein [Paenibacillus frigoriresistens]|uniref:PD-(D/E)XK motif protein n=1 Tax=Paenibacillus alginolyticus TaxID=59839 RepID=UPI001566BE73|nr:PD-(D/E)XK motif protein [Paenibacillus frigoriresistens]NRF96204.1 PD-(D/E)XK motif protein [Paenibacillus frigoriresistens]
MLYHKINLNAWQDLSKKQSENENMVVSLDLNPDMSGIYSCIFVSTNHSYHHFIEVESPQVQDLIDPQVAGLGLKLLRNHFITGRRRKTYIDVECSALPHLEAFTELVNNCSEQIFVKKFAPSVAINNVIRNNKSFWAKTNQHMTEEEQQGLFGELHIIKSLLEKGNEKVIESWTGPSGNRNDFVFEFTSLEIKTALGLRHEHIINGLEQFEPVNDNLGIVSILLSKHSGGKNIVHLVKEITDLLQHQPDLYETFIEKVKLTDYDEQNYEHYARFVIGETLLYPVEDDFPCIKESDFINGLPSRISKICYRIDLQGLVSYELSEPEFLDFINSN